MKKFFFLVLLAIVSTQAIYAESYQRWVYWVSPENHEVTASEMAEITSLLYDNKIVVNKEFSLSSGVRLRIPQPALYLSYIVKAVRSANPAALTRDDIIYCLNDAEKMRWGNDIVGSYKNYYYSYVYKGVRHIDNFSGEGKDVDFLFINGIPAIKCDCGNPIERQDPVPVLKQEEPVPTSPNPAEGETLKEEPAQVKIIVRNVYREPDYRQPIDRVPPKIKKNNLTVVWIVGGVVIGLGGLAGLIYCLVSGSSNGAPGGAPTTPPTPGGPGGTPPSGGGGPGGSPL